MGASRPIKARLWKIEPRCLWCGKPTVFSTGRPDSATIDHIRPTDLSSAGVGWTCVAIACARCNNHRPCKLKRARELTTEERLSSVRLRRGQRKRKEKP